MIPDLEADVAALEAMDLQSLRQVWSDRFGDPPKLRSVDVVRRILAWRMQLDAVGGLSPELKAALKLSRPASPKPKLPSGARLGREWRGVRHDVEIEADGVRYQGRLFDSLSAVAREITGVRWNGPRFFGLRQDEVRSER